MSTFSTGRITALAQFRDNILLASAGPRATSVVRDARDTLTNAWNVPGLCPCTQNPGD